MLIEDTEEPMAYSKFISRSLAETFVTHLMLIADSWLICPVSDLRSYGRPNATSDFLTELTSLISLSRVDSGSWAEPVTYWDSPAGWVTSHFNQSNDGNTHNYLKNMMCEVKKE